MLKGKRPVPNVGLAYIYVMSVQYKGILLYSNVYLAMTYAHKMHPRFGIFQHAQATSKVAPSQKDQNIQT